MAIWAYEELAHGVNWFRHLLGLAYIIFTSAVETHKQPDELTHAHTLPIMQSAAQVLFALVPGGDKSHVLAIPASSNTAAAPSDVPVPKPNPRAAPPKGAKHGQKGYGARDRRALDNLIQQTNDGGQKP